ncbi:MAG TPA: hypothetical protein VNJ31_08075 [Methyloceanibacter sp.]|nr:hypothetical protein [Methyloceanibacter sp.]
MRGAVITAIAAILAALVIAGTKPASAAPPATAIAYGKADAGVFEPIKHRYRYVRKWRPYRYYAYPYYYRPYYYRPYAYYYPRYYWGYPYYRRPGFGLWFGW